MLIGKSHKIESDNLNVMLYELHPAGVNKKTGKEFPDRWEVTGYYSNVKNALHSLVEKEIAGTGFKDFKTVADKVQELHDLIAALNLPTKV